MTQTHPRTIPQEREVRAEDIQRFITPEEQQHTILLRIVRLMQKQNTFIMTLFGQKMQLIPPWVAEANEELAKLVEELER